MCVVQCVALHTSSLSRALTCFYGVGTSQSVANMYAELVGPPYSLEGREGMRKGQFQQLMHQIKVPMPRTGTSRTWATHTHTHRGGNCSRL
jgi:hypothetical protein